MMSRHRRGSASATPARDIIGWRERVGLPEIGLNVLPAKIDTGARTSALHASHVREFQRDGRTWLRFHIPHASGVRAHDCEAPMTGRRGVRNTSGIGEDRYLIETLLVLGRRRWRIEVSLADRAEMTMPLILGRTAIRRHRLAVDPGRSYLWGAPVIGGKRQARSLPRLSVASSRLTGAHSEGTPR